MTAAQSFKPDEWAVLPHTNGARLFQVHVVEEDDVVERSTFPDQQQFALRVAPYRLIKIASLKEGEGLIERFRVIAENRDRLVWQARAQADGDFSRLIREARGQ